MYEDCAFFSGTPYIQSIGLLFLMACGLHIKCVHFVPINQGFLSQYLTMSTCTVTSVHKIKHTYNLMYSFDLVYIGSLPTGDITVLLCEQ